MNPLNFIIEFLISKDKLKLAEGVLDEFCESSSNIEQLDVLGKMYHDIKSYKKAIEVTEKALTLCNSNEQIVSVRSNLIKLYNHVNEPKLSLKNIDKIELICGFQINMQMERVFAHYLLNEKSKSEYILRDLFENHQSELDEDTKNKILFNLGTYDMENGHFKKGLNGFIAVGHKMGIWKKRYLKNEWDGTIKPGLTLAVVENFGIGDSIINVRFMKILENRGMKPIWVTNRKDLHTVYNRNGFKTVCSEKEVYDIDPSFMYIEAMMLPILLNLDAEEIGREKYLVADPLHIEKWKDKLNLGSKNIGIRWQGNKMYEQDLHRSLPLSDLIDVIPEEFNIVSLQRDDGSEELDLIEREVHTIGYHGSEMETIEDTLAIISLLDIVVTSCTSIAHMSAALGKETVVMPPIAMYYTWTGRNDSKSWFYGDNLTIFNQTEWRSWEEPMKKLKEFIRI